jgi:hypothetical protein
MLQHPFGYLLYHRNSRLERLVYVQCHLHHLRQEEIYDQALINQSINQCQTFSQSIKKSINKLIIDQSKK